MRVGVTVRHGEYNMIGVMDGVVLGAFSRRSGCFFDAYASRGKPRGRAFWPRGRVVPPKMSWALKLIKGPRDRLM